MPILSVITPVYQPEPDHLTAAYESVKDQEMPSGWEWEWMLQEDGSSGVAKEILPDDGRIRFGQGRKGGVAITRNLALSAAKGQLVKNLDQDDILTDGVLSRDIRAIEGNDGVRWTTSRVLDLLPDGSLVGFDNDPEHGRLRTGVVVEHWREHNFRLPVHPTTMCIERKLAVALGGWMAVPGSDDTGLLTAASVVADGFFESEVGLHYRKWPGQESAMARHTETVEWNARMHLISERAEFLAQAVAVANS
ncbi:glycosyltransferase [Saccharomonospora sp. NPDC006951]